MKSLKVFLLLVLTVAVTSALSSKQEKDRYAPDDMWEDVYDGLSPMDQAAIDTFTNWGKRELRGKRSWWTDHRDTITHSALTTAAGALLGKRGLRERRSWWTKTRDKIEDGLIGSAVSAGTAALLGREAEEKQA